MRDPAARLLWCQLSPYDGTVMDIYDISRVIVCHLAYSRARTDTNLLRSHHGWYSNLCYGRDLGEAIEVHPVVILKDEAESDDSLKQFKGQVLDGSPVSRRNTSPHGTQLRSSPPAVLNEGLDEVEHIDRHP